MIDFHGNKPSSTVAQLQQRIRRLERGTTPAETILHSTGCRGLDALFPVGGVRQGSLVEWIEGGLASGAGTLSLTVGRTVGRGQRPLVVIDPRRQVYPLALKTLGFDLQQVVIVRPKSERDALWACEEALRSQTGGIVWAQLDRLSLNAARRLRLAAEESSGVCLLVRPQEALRQTSWSEVRLLVEPYRGETDSAAYRVTVAYCQGRPGAGEVIVSMDRRQGTVDELPRTNTPNPLSLVS